MGGEPKQITSKNLSTGAISLSFNAKEAEIHFVHVELRNITQSTSRACLFVGLKYKEMSMGIYKSLNSVNLYRVLSMLKLKINVNLPHLLFIVVAATES